MEVLQKISEFNFGTILFFIGIVLGVIVLIYLTYKSFNEDLNSINRKLAKERLKRIKKRKNMKTIVAICAFQKAGKDTIGEIFINRGYKRIAFADKVKEDFVESLQRPSVFKSKLTLEELEKNKDQYRDKIVSFAEKKRFNNPLYWVDRAKDDIELSKDNIIITDLRRVVEIDYLLNLKKLGYKVYLFNLIRPYSNGGKFENDPETCKAILYAEYGGFFDSRIINAATKEELEKVIDQVIIDYKL